MSLGLDQNLPRVKADSRGISFSHAHLFLVARGDIEEGADHERRVHRIEEGEHVIVFGFGEELEEFLVLLLSDFLFGEVPKWFDRVDPFSVDVNGEPNKIAVALNDSFNLNSR